MKKKQLSSPFATGGGGVHFEACVQASFLALMLTGGFAPGLPCCPITKIKLQGKHEGYETDDLIVFVEKPSAGQSRKMFAQIKHSISITLSDKDFGEVMMAAWSDFISNRNFTKNKDIIALITGPLSCTDSSSVRDILEWARYSEDAAGFFKKVMQSKISSKTKREKLNVFRVKLQEAKGEELYDEELFRFLQHFYLLGYDLDIKAGVALSLLHSLIGQYSQENVQNLWARLVQEVQSANKRMGTITIDMLPEDLQAAFDKPKINTFPFEFSASALSEVAPIWSPSLYKKELVVANLIGSWNENNEFDRAIISQMANGEDYFVWNQKMREILQQDGAPLVFKNGIWSIAKRQELFQELGSYLYDDNLTTFKRCAVTVLKELDPQFELPKEDRFAASMHGKVLKHSQDLRKGIAVGVALLGNDSKSLVHCTNHKGEEIAVLTVRDILHKADFMLWGSLNNVLPCFAEAAPDTFLEAVENGIQANPNPFDELFLEESDGVFGRNYLVGLYWALETLAWDEQYLVQVTVTLGLLAERDPGGQWSNRPMKSLRTIFLPWFPQTAASIEKRKVALQTLRVEKPDIAWKVLIGLLPDKIRSTSGSHKPEWRKLIPSDWKDGVSQLEYQEQVAIYAEIAVEMAKQDFHKLNDLVAQLDHLPLLSLKEILKYIASDEVVEKSEQERLPIWNELKAALARYKRKGKTKRSINPDIISTIEKVSQQVAPSDPLNLYRRLFDNRTIDLYEEVGDWEKQQKLLEKHQQQAVREVLQHGGSDAIIRFAEAVENPSNVGLILGCVANSSIDVAILPAMLDQTDEKRKQFVRSYVWSRRQDQGWSWVDQVFSPSWSRDQTVRFLTYLPFCEETWQRVSTMLGENENENEYWLSANVAPQQAGDALPFAIEKLLKLKRPYGAINCIKWLRYQKKPWDKNQAVQALLAAVSSKEPTNQMDAYHMVELIKALQDDTETDPDDLFHIEWVYLPLLEREEKAAPKCLENRLKSDPLFYCEIIRLVYRSDKESNSVKEPSEQQENLASNAYRLLDKWRTPPGVNKEGHFSETNFRKWFETVKEISRESGHFDVAMSHIGNVLVYAPPDPSGLSIERAAAEVLNNPENDIMRQGYRMEILNSRGVYLVDPSGAPELELAAKYASQAEEVENAGYHRLAVTLKSIVESYRRQAEEIIEEHRRES